MANGQTARNYLDITADPVIPNGVGKEQEAALLRNGWERKPLQEDIFAHVQFRNAERRPYYLDGWLKAGTEVFVPKVRLKNDGPFDDFGVLQACGNPVIVGEEKFGW